MSLGLTCVGQTGQPQYYQLNVDSGCVIALLYADRVLMALVGQFSVE